MNKIFYNNPKLAWYKANQNDINIYKHKYVNVLLFPAYIENCCHSVSHRADISQRYDKLVDIMVSASEHMSRTRKPNEKTPLPGWTTFVKHFKDKSIYWKEMYDNQKPNVSLYTTYMIKTSRNAYH